VTCDPEATGLIRRMFDAALAAADPLEAVARTIERSGRGIDVDGNPVPVDGKLVLVAIGKAAERMADGAVKALGDRIDSGFVVTKYGHVRGSLDGRFQIYEASHPVPDQAGIAAARATLDALADLGPEDVVLALISGGGSALFEAPRDPISLDDFAQLTQLLLSAGAPIQDLNAVRIPLSAVKGGRLRQSSPAGRFVTLILSDVLGNDPQVVASGPTVPGRFTRENAQSILQKYSLTGIMPRSISQVLNSAASAQPDRDFAGDILLFVADNSTALEAATARARHERVPAEIIWRVCEGEAAELGREWVNGLASRRGPVVLLGGGEATVTVKGDGAGGRNTEFALAAGLELERRDLTHWTVASLATDGQDAQTDAAGAIVCVDTVKRARKAGVDPARCLEDNDSLRVFDNAGGLVVTGPTGTNVNDLYFAVDLRSND
jgi:glycerate 2-kinase